MSRGRAAAALALGAILLILVVAFRRTRSAPELPTLAPAPAASEESPAPRASIKIIPAAGAPASVPLAAAKPLVPTLVQMQTYDGRPLPACRIIALGNGRSILDTPASPDASCRPSLEIREGPQRLVAIPEDPTLAIATADAEIRVGAEAALALSLQPARAVEGVVVDAGGRPVPNAQVEIEVLLPPDGRRVASEFAHLLEVDVEYVVDREKVLVRVRSDGEGRFKAFRIPPGAVKAEASAAGLENTQSIAEGPARIVLPGLVPERTRPSRR